MAQPVGGVTLVRSNFRVTVGRRYDVLVAIVPPDINRGGFPARNRLRGLKETTELPAGLSSSWNNETGEFRVFGSPLPAFLSTYTATYTVRADLSGVDDQDYFNYTITVSLRPSIEQTAQIVEGTVGERLLPTQVANISDTSSPSSEIIVASSPPLPTGLTISASARSGRVLIGGVPTVAASGLYIFTAKELTQEGGIFDLEGSATVHLTIKTKVPPAPIVSLDARQTKRAGTLHAAFRVATITNAELSDITVSGLASLGLRWRLRGTELQLFGYIPSTVAPHEYTITIRVRTQIDEHPTIFRTFGLLVTAAPSSPVVPTVIPPPSWEGIPDVVNLTQNVRVSPGNPIALGTLSHSQRLAIRLVVTPRTLPRNMSVVLRPRDGSVFLQGTPVEAGNFTAVMEATAGESDPLEVRLDIQVDPEIVPDPEPIPEPDPCLLYTSPSPRDRQKSRMPSSA